ncbi:hypothetical protein HMPREF3198_00551 [Winkia neuii]|nr:hypothetical protein HMPREF3198_00551 [Winkia neuii]
MQKAAEANLSVLGLTDHDTQAGWAEAAAAVSLTGVALLRGTEISCAAQGRTVHLLAYLFDPSNQVLQGFFEKCRASRLVRAKKMVEKLAVDYPITWDEVCRFSPSATVVGRPHIADALVANGAFANRSEVFQKVLHPSHKYYVRHWAPDPVEATAAVRAAGGVPVWAHPRATSRQRLVPTTVLAKMVDAGLFGLEANHRDHSAEMRQAVLTMAAHYGLEVTGSSDYHGTGKPNLLGENLTSERVLEKIEAQAALQLVRP